MTPRLLTAVVAAALLAGCLGGGGSRERDVPDDAAIRAHIAVMEEQLRAMSEVTGAEVRVGDGGVPGGPFVNFVLSFTTQGLDQDALDALVRDRSAWLWRDPGLPDVQSLRALASDDQTDAESSLAELLGQSFWNTVDAAALEAAFGPRFADS